MLLKYSEHSIWNTFKYIQQGRTQKKVLGGVFEN